MTIGIDASKLATAHKTGVEWYVHHLLRAMREIPNAHSFRLYTRDPLPYALPPAWEGRKIFWPFPLLWTKGGLSLEMLTAAPDLLFVPSSALPCALPRACVTTIHDVGFMVDRAYRSARELRCLENAARYAARKATRIICVSEFSKQEFVRLFDADETRITVTHLSHTPAPEQSQGTIDGIRARLSLVRPFLIFVSRIDSRKNIRGVIKAFSILKDRAQYDGDLVLVGPLGYDGALLLSEARQTRWASSIRHVGWLCEEEKYALLKSADCFVFPSFYEGFGLAVLEAQSVGLPVVCSQTTSLPEVAGDGALFVDPRSAESIADGVASILCRSAVRCVVVQKGFENCARFSWTRTAEKTIDTLENAGAAAH